MPVSDKPWEEARPSTKPKSKEPAAVRPLEHLALTQVRLPDLSLSASGTFNQRLKQARKLSKNPSPAEIAELTVYLTAPESSLRWLASTTLSKTGGPQVSAVVKALLEQDINEEAVTEARKLLHGLNNMP